MARAQTLLIRQERCLSPHCARNDCKDGFVMTLRATYLLTRRGWLALQTPAEWRRACNAGNLQGIDAVVQQLVDCASHHPIGTHP